MRRLVHSLSLDARPSIELLGPPRTLEEAIQRNRRLRERENLQYLRLSCASASAASRGSSGVAAPRLSENSLSRKSI